jgi:hypothetical protein
MAAPAIPAVAPTTFRRLYVPDRDLETDVMSRVMKRFSFS